MDQAIGDLQGQVEEMRKRWEEERAKSERLERELEALRDKDGDDRSRGGKRPRVD
jgi:peptidoglycan hydrolase CwlO-like protein